MLPRSVVLGATLLWTCGCAARAGSDIPAPAVGAPAVSSATGASGPALGLARRTETVESLHGRQVADPYRWLEDVAAPETQAFMRAHDARARAVLRGLPGRERFRGRLKALSYVDTRSAPTVRGERRFWSEKPADREKAIFYWQDGEGEEKVLLDPIEVAPEGTLAIKSVLPSPDGTLVAVLESPDNADESTLKIMRVATGEVLESDTIRGLRYNQPSWNAEGDAFVYTWLPEAGVHPPNERMGYALIKRHRIGTNPEEDEVIRPALKDPTRWQSARYTEDGRWIVVTETEGWSSSSIFVASAAEDGELEWSRLTPPGERAIYRVVGVGDRLFIRTNEGASNYRVFSAAPGSERRTWKEIVPEDPEAVVKEIRIAGGHLVVHAMRRAHSVIEVRTLDGRKVRDVNLDGLGSIGGLVTQAESDDVYMAFEGFERPDEIWRTNVRTGETARIHRPKVPLDPKRFRVEQVRYPSRDGTEITMFVVRRAGAEKSGSHPTHLYGYGGFNIARTPRFDPLVAAWVEAGGIYAVANLRGGGEYGEAWHRGGMLENKQNVFDDFIAAAEWLTADGSWTSPERLAIYGRSNGGLLVGAAVTQRPDLFRAVVCGVPLLDMIRYHRFGIGRAWIPEYGTAEDPAQFPFLLAYSPYHRLTKGTRYPALLMLSADRDDRVDPLHARKFVAAYRAANGSARETLLRIEANSGHGGGDQRSKRVERQADLLAFLGAELRLE